MNDTNRDTKKHKITYTATTQGIERAGKALKRLGFGSQANFAKSILISRSTVTKFFGGKKPIQLDSFQRICEELKLCWKEIAELPAEESLTSLISQDSSFSVINEDQPSTSTPTLQITVRNKHENRTKAVITLQGDLDSVSNKNILVSILKEYGGDTIEIETIKSGSIKVFISGSPEDIERLKSRIESGEIKKINEFPVDNIEITKPNDKWRLVEEIVNHPYEGRSLKSIDLSDADLSGANLIGADLSDADLIGADLSRADLIGADLIGADLRDADLSYTNLIGADLSDADLSRANLRNTKIDERTNLNSKWRLVWEIVNQGAKGKDLSRADLSRANLSGANLIGADLSRADLIGADLIRAYLSGANLSGANLSGADLIGAYLIGTYLRDAYLIDANLRDADLSGANLSDANLIRANLIRADLSDADLSDAYLSGAYLIRADLSYANLIGAYLSGAYLSYADLSYAYLSDANLSDADLRDANLIRANLRNTKIDERTNLNSKWRLVWEIINQGAKGKDLSRANLSRANLIGADLSRANLIGADLSRADLSDADLSGANLSGAYLSGAYLSRADLSDADLSDVRVENARFGNNKGISESQKQYLIDREASFEDDPGDRHLIFSR